LLEDLFLEAYPQAPQEITPDLDATNDIVYGRQEGRFYHGYCRDYCYRPLYAFCGEHLLCARLRMAHDTRDIDARMFIESGESADLPIAMLAGGGPERLTEILKRAANLRGSERQRVLAELIQLCGLRSLQQPLIMELKSMASPNDTFLMIPQVQDMIRNARTQMLRDQLTAKFRTLPKWADEKLESATSAQVQRWSRKILTAETLEGVLGKK
jgi:hypothetical protein